MCLPRAGRREGADPCAASCRSMRKSRKLLYAQRSACADARYRLCVKTFSRLCRRGLTSFGTPWGPTPTKAGGGVHNKYRSLKVIAGLSLGPYSTSQRDASSKAECQHELVVIS